MEGPGRDVQDFFFAISFFGNKKNYTDKSCL